jgi:hypothetical protein
MFRTGAVPGCCASKPVSGRGWHAPSTTISAARTVRARRRVLDLVALIACSLPTERRARWHSAGCSKIGRLRSDNRKKCDRDFALCGMSHLANKSM